MALAFRSNAFQSVAVARTAFRCAAASSQGGLPWKPAVANVSYPSAVAVPCSSPANPALHPMHGGALRHMSASVSDEQVKDAVLCNVDADGFVTVTLNRPDSFNTFSDLVIARFSQVFDDLRDQKGIRGAFFKAKGKLFCAGADLAWMKRTTSYTREQNLRDAQQLGEMLAKLNTLPFPTIALVQGASFGGGVGLVSCCDIAVGVEKAKFTLSEVKLGLIPATISPYVVARIGPTQARRYFLTAEQFDANRAKEIGLLHEVVSDAAGLDEWEQEFRSRLTAAAPTAVVASKELVSAVAGKEITSTLITDTARRLCDQRASPEGVEGLTAFFEKRHAKWTLGGSH